MENLLSEEKIKQIDNIFEEFTSMEREERRCGIREMLEHEDVYYDEAYVDDIENRISKTQRNKKYSKRYF